MKAIQIQSYGGLEVLRTTTLSDPDPGPDEVLVRIKASAVNPLDGIVRMGHFPIAKEPPLILGEEAAGIVDRNGAGFKAGERVIVYGGGLGVFRDGTWAEAVAVPGSCLRRMPEGMSFEEAAALANVGVTAYGALRTAALKAGETLVVLGATGGVGSAGVQIGKAIGARVIAVVSTAGKAANLQSLGADHVAALSGGPLAEQVRGLTKGKGSDVVLDSVGGDVTGQALSSLASFGRLVHLGYSAGTTLRIDSLDLIAKPSTIIGFNTLLVPSERSARDLDEVVDLSARGRYRAAVDRTFPAPEAAEATRYLERVVISSHVMAGENVPWRRAVPTCRRAADHSAPLLAAPPRELTVRNGPDDAVRMVMEITATMRASTVLMMAAVLTVAPRVSAACRPFGTQFECDVGSSRVVIGTQAAAQPTRVPSVPFLSFAGDACLPNDLAPTRGLQVQLQDVGTDPKLCRKIGNETYCY